MEEELLLCVTISVVKDWIKTEKKLLALFWVLAIAGQNLHATLFSLEDILRLLKTILL